MLRLAITLILFFFFFSSCNRDEHKSNAAQDVIALQERSAEVSQDSTYWYLKKATTLIKTADLEIPDSIKAENNYLIGNYFQSLTKMDSAAVYFHNATDFSKDSITGKKNFKYFQAAWNAYANLGLHGDCFTITEKFKSLLDPEKQFRALSWAYYWEETTYEMMGDYQKALQSNEQRVELARTKDSINYPPALVKQASIKYNFLKDKKGAFQILEKLLENEKNLTYNVKRQVNGDYGVYQYYDGNYTKALYHYLKAASAAKNFIENRDYTNDLANSYNNIAEVYLDLKQYNNSRIYLDSVRLLGIANLAKRKQKALLNYELRLAVETNKNSKELSTVLDEIYKQQDEAYKQKSQNELLELTKTNEKQKQLLKQNQAAEIENLKLQTRSIILIVSIILLTLIGFLFYGQRKLKFEKQSLQLQQRLFRSQMTPHFTYNTLYAIQKEIRKDPKSAENYLLKFSRLLRLVLENSMNNYVLLHKELEAIEKYLDLQLIHAPNKFSYEVILDGLEEDELVFIPPMLLQPIIENSIEHGFSGIDYPGKLILTLTLKDKFIHCSIDDNGKGLQKGTGSEKQSASTKLIQDFLKKSTKKGFSILNKQDQNSSETGILVQFLIPYKLTEND